MNNSTDISGLPDLNPNWQAIPEGTPVFTVDGQELGTVREQLEDGLLVGGSDPGAPVYVVTSQDVSRIDRDGVHLLVTESQAMRAARPPRS